MNVVTLAMAKAYADSTRLGSVTEMRETVVADCEVEFLTDNEFGTPMHKFTHHLNLFAEDTIAIEIVWNGKTYRCDASGIDDHTGNFGNAALSGGEPDTGEPFYGVQLTEVNNGALTFIASAPGIVHLKVERIREVVNPIDRKYIPALDYIILNGADGKPYKLSVDESGQLVTEALYT